MKKLLLLVILCPLIIFSQKIQFKDKNFEKVILSRYDTNKNGSIDENEYASVTTINLRGIQIESYEDVYLFRARKLLLGNFPIKSLIIKNHPTLAIIHCGNCNLTTFEVENIPNLESVEVNNNSLKSFSIKNCPKLYSLNLSDNLLKSVEVNSFINLESLYVSNNSLQNLDIQNLVKLKDLRINNNKIAKLDLSKNINLNFLFAYGNNLRISDITKPYEKDIWIELKEPIEDGGTSPSSR